MVTANTFTINNGLLGVAGLGARVGSGPVYKDDAEAPAGGGTTSPANDVVSAFTATGAPKAPALPSRLKHPLHAWDAMGRAINIKWDIGILDDYISLANTNPFAAEKLRKMDLSGYAKKSNSILVVQLLSKAAAIGNVSAAMIVLSAAHKELTKMIDGAPVVPQAFDVLAEMKVPAFARPELAAKYITLKNDATPAEYSEKFLELDLEGILKGSASQSYWSVRQYAGAFLQAFQQATDIHLWPTIIKGDLPSLVQSANTGSSGAVHQLAAIHLLTDDVGQAQVKEHAMGIDPSKLVQVLKSVDWMHEEVLTALKFLVSIGSEKAKGSMVDLLDIDNQDLHRSVLGEIDQDFVVYKAALLERLEGGDLFTYDAIGDLELGDELTDDLKAINPDRIAAKILKNFEQNKDEGGACADMSVLEALAVDHNNEAALKAIVGLVGLVPDLATVEALGDYLDEVPEEQVGSESAKMAFKAITDALDSGSRVANRVLRKLAVSPKYRDAVEKYYFARITAGDIEAAAVLAESFAVGNFPFEPTATYLQTLSPARLIAALAMFLPPVLHGSQGDQLQAFLERYVADHFGLDARIASGLDVFRGPPTELQKDEE